jgi:hypothetical protein
MNFRNDQCTETVTLRPKVINASRSGSPILEPLTCIFDKDHDISLSGVLLRTESQVGKRQTNKKT